MINRYQLQSLIIIIYHQFYVTQVLSDSFSTCFVTPKADEGGEWSSVHKARQ